MRIFVLSFNFTHLWWAPLMALIGATPEEVNGVSHWAPYISNFRWKNETQQQLYSLLISSHWIRVALITAYGILLFYISMLALDIKTQ